MLNQDLRNELIKAKAGHYGVPAFNFNDIWDMGAIIKGAGEARAPVMLMAVPRVMECIGLKAGAAMVRAAAGNASVPAFLHLDHCTDVDYCKACVDVGFDCVMIDASAFPLEENIRRVKEVCDYAHEKGVIVEAELGRVMGNNEEGVYEGEDYLIQTNEAVQLVEETGVDMLAVGIGTAHGFYKGKPKIHFERLEELNQVISIPLVLHGGTGIPIGDVHRGLELGICKMNIGAALRFAYISSLKEQLKEAEPTAHPLDIHMTAREEIKMAVLEGIYSLKADGRGISE